MAETQTTQKVSTHKDTEKIRILWSNQQKFETLIEITRFHFTKIKLFYFRPTGWCKLAAKPNGSNTNPTRFGDLALEFAHWKHFRHGHL